MNHATVETFSLESLLARADLVSLFFHNTLPSGRVFVILHADTGPCGMIGVDFEDGIAQLGPLSAVRILDAESRRELWMSAIDCARRERAVACQIICGDDDLAPLRSLGWEPTTEIVELVCPAAHRGDARDQTIERYPSFRTASLRLAFTPSRVRSERELREPTLRELIRRTMIDSLDLPEALAGRSPDDLLASWNRTISDAHLVLLVAHGIDGPLGLLVASRLPTGTVIRYLGVDPACRSQGWGSKLVQGLLTLVSDTPVTAYLDVRNGPAAGLYRKLGFLEQHRSPLIFRRLG